MDANALYQVAHINQQREQYALVAECQQRNLCADMVKSGCFISEDKDENRFLVFCKADYQVVKSYPPGEEK